MRPVRKRPAPEDFLGKGPNKKILMGKYVGIFFSTGFLGFGWLVGLGVLTVFLVSSIQTCSL